MTLDEFVTKALSVPFVEKGRGFAGWDCWGVVCVGLWEVAKVYVPSYTDGYDTTRGNEGGEQLKRLIAANMESWQPAAQPFRPLDVALFRISGRPIHVGLMVDRARVLHAEEKVGTFIERLSSPMWARRLEGVYRHADLR